MQSGRIAPVFRQILNNTLSAKSATDSSSQQKEQQQQAQREPTKDEAEEALGMLAQQEEFQKNALSAKLEEQDGRLVITVFNKNGAQLKVLRGAEILRILEISRLGHKGPYLGRILDRRI
ncbi:MAG TPA: hypothetical protein VIH99_00835 [Bdellovibrionota bacterium]|jgi:uncharacterized FlaG/YvyC family protein